MQQSYAINYKSPNKFGTYHKLHYLCATKNRKNMQNKSPLSVLIHDQAAHYGAREALLFRNDKTGIWEPISWNEFSLNVRKVSNALLELGVEAQENVDRASNVGWAALAEGLMQTISEEASKWQV